MNDREITDLAGKAMGWVDYPTDSVEQGSIWHLDKQKAPFGRILSKRDWTPLTSILQAMDIAFELDFSVLILEHEVKAFTKCGLKSTSCTIESKDKKFEVVCRAITVLAAETQIELKW